MTDLPLSSWPKPCFAGFWRRLGAYLIDWLLAQALTTILFNLSIHHHISATQGNSLWWYQLLQLAVFLTYFTASMLVLKGQTVGKYLLHLKVIHITNGKLDRQSLLIREIAGRTLLYYLPILTLTLVFTRQRQHLLDLLLDTAVVDLKQVAYFTQIRQEGLIKN